MTPEETKAAAELCRIYFEIAAEAIGEEEVRKQRDKRIAKMKNPPNVQTLGGLALRDSEIAIE